MSRYTVEKAGGNSFAVYDNGKNIGIVSTMTPNQFLMMIAHANASDQMANPQIQPPTEPDTQKP